MADASASESPEQFNRRQKGVDPQLPFGTTGGECSYNFSRPFYFFITPAQAHYSFSAEGRQRVCGQHTGPTAKRGLPEHSVKLTPALFDLNEDIHLLGLDGQRAQKSSGSHVALGPVVGGSWLGAQDTNTGQRTEASFV